MSRYERLSIKYKNGQLQVLDQTLLPHQERWLLIETPDQMVDAIKRLAVRGAPLIGVAAAMSWGLWAQSGAPLDAVFSAGKSLRNSRPTAVNLMNAIDRMARAFENSNHDRSCLLKEALAIFDEDIELCEKLAQQMAALIKDGDTLLTHCNTGGLATAGRGTALGGIKLAHEQGKRIHVYIDETRPLGQGSRLTAWELEKSQVPCTLICDNMAGFLMSRTKINGIFVGADRIATNGDTANKIGTYSVAVLARHHKIPFYIVAPSTTLDPECHHGDQIPIEERSESEVRGQVAPTTVKAWNPAFDVTPHSLISGIVLEDRVWQLT